MSKRVELGCAGHLIVSNRCRWKRHTQVGNFRITTIGDYFLDDKRETLGAGQDSYFETMIFETTGKPERGSEGCGCQEVKEWGEIDGSRYPTAGKAQAGHEEFVEKYIRKLDTESEETA